MVNELPELTAESLVSGSDLHVYPFGMNITSLNTKRCLPKESPLAFKVSEMAIESGRQMLWGRTIGDWVHG